jgi:alanine racemase/UDP-N-acetylmuramoyl-tripeptide--D-alanyl-D-alanine ligase
MHRITISRLAEIVHGTVNNQNTHASIQHVSIHSDRIRSSTAFFALSGSHNDGYDFVERAYANGSSVAVVSAHSYERKPTTKVPLIIVDDVVAALRLLATWWRQQLRDTTFIAVVGNTGKTVTKDALAHFLGYASTVYCSPGSYNSQIGVPLSIIDCPQNAQYAIIEAATSQLGEMRPHVNLIRPSYALITNVGSRFQADFGGLSNQADELGVIAGSLDENSWLLLGQSNEILRSMTSTLATKTYIVGESYDLPQFSPSTHDSEFTSSTVVFRDGTKGTLTVRTPSENLLTDVQLALTAAALLGVETTLLLSAAADYRPTSARMEVWRTPTGAILVRDIATIDGATFANAMRVTQRLTGGPHAKSIVVLADKFDHYHPDAARALGRTIGRSGADILCTMADTPSHQLIADGFTHVSPSATWVGFETIESIRQYLADKVAAGDVILIQSPRARTLPELSQHFLDPIAPTRLYIDKAAIKENVAAIRRLIGPNVQLMVMVKALAYGTDPVQMSMSLQEAGVDALAVATFDEAKALRRAGITLETIMVMLGTEADLGRAVRDRLAPLIYSPAMLEAVLNYAKTSDAPIDVHLEVDSGMHRTGFAPREAKAAMIRLREIPSIKLAGLMTHFACADDPLKDDFTRSQLHTFLSVIDEAHSLGFRDFIRHAANTAATLRLPKTHFDMVRVGIGILGIQPSHDTALQLELTPAISLVSTIVEIHRLPPGEHVGYGATFQTPASAMIGVVPAGYDDCFPRALSNVGSVFVHGVRCPIVGTISMDSMTIDLTHCPGATVGSNVLIYGGLDSSFISIEDVARSLSTIPYELLTRIGPRTQRIFTEH